jgi:hypothetical protein
MFRQIILIMCTIPLYLCQYKVGTFLPSAWQRSWCRRPWNYFLTTFDNFLTAFWQLFDNLFDYFFSHTSVFQFIGPSNDGRRHGRGTYLLECTSLGPSHSFLQWVVQKKSLFGQIINSDSSHLQWARVRVDNSYLTTIDVLVARGSEYNISRNGMYTVQGQMKNPNMIECASKWHLFFARGQYSCLVRVLVEGVVELVQGEH